MRVSFDEVAAHLAESDSSGDAYWVQLITEECAYYTQWMLGEVAVADLTTLMDEVPVDHHDALNIPIVVTPDRLHPGKWTVVDGNHRATQALLDGLQFLPAYFPLDL